MDADSEEMPVQRGKLRQRSSGNWYVQCRWCDKEARLEAPNEEEAYGMLHEWRLSMPRRQYHQRNWSCPCCAKWWQDTTPTATDTAGSAGEPAAKRAKLLPNVRQEVWQLKAEIVELKAEVERLNAEVVELKDVDTKQTTKARPGPTIVALRTGGGMAHPPVRCGRLFAAAERSIHRVGPGVSGGSRAPPLFPADCSNDRAHAPPLKALQNLINSKLACLRIPLLCWMFVEGVADKAAHVDEI